ncbi:MAG: curli production assembly/transport protein CsgG [Pseudomonadota bacterium]|nr:curli production assembly/transport protein CsgG [Pseudomonadota bacterium]
MARLYLLFVMLVAMLAAGCVTAPISSRGEAQAHLSSPTKVTRDLFQLPPPKGKVVVAVYGFRDQTGQYKPSPESSFSTAVTQGAGAILIKALQDSGWFIPVERENLQNLLTERKIVRALESPPEKGVPAPQVPQLLPASILMEGGVTAYDSNIRTGGLGAGFLGISLSTQYRVDQVTVSLRSVDIRSGRILGSVSTTKSLLSYEVRPSVFKFGNFKDLAQFEAGVTRNEPAELCVREAIESAVVFLIVRGVANQHWALSDPRDWDTPLIKAYLQDDPQPATRRKD